MSDDNSSRRSGASGQPQVHEHLVASDRGQTSIDILLAVSIFLVAVSLLAVQHPMLFFPASLSATDYTTTADTVATELETDTLAANGSTALSHDLVVTFFTRPDSTLHTEISLPTGYRANVSLIYQGSAQPTAFSDVGYRTGAGGASYVSRGPDPGDAVTTVNRTTRLEAERITLQVTVWEQ